MKLKLNLSRPDGSHADLSVTLDADCTIGALADRLEISDPRRDPAAALSTQTLVRAEHGRSRVLSRSSAVVESGLVSGDSVALSPDVKAPSGAGTVAAVLTVLSGPDAGRTFDLKTGSNTVGRGRQSAVQLSDPMVSTLHARIVVGQSIEIVDENSSNGILMGGEQVSRVLLGPDDEVLLGDDLIRVSPTAAEVTGLGASGAVGPTVEFNRSPRVDPDYEGVKLVAPEPPTPPRQQRFPIASVLTPILMGAVLIAVLGRWEVVLFLALSPVMLIGAWYENRRANKADYEQLVNTFRANLTALVAEAHGEQDEERRRRGNEHPSTADVVDAIGNRNELLWTRRPEHSRFMELRMGLGTQESRVTFDVNPSRNSMPELVAELTSVTDRFKYVERVPVVVSLERSGSIGVAGPNAAVDDVARGLLFQLTGLHSPAELVICGLASGAGAERWDWVKWLPHTSSDHSPIEGEHLASTPPGCSNLVARLTDLVEARTTGSEAGESGSSDLPRVVVLVEDDAPVDRNRLVTIAETGPGVGVHLMWLAPNRTQIPAACRSYLEVHPADGSVSTGRVVEGELSHPVLVEPVDASSANALARAISPVVDAGALAEDQTNLPSSVSFLADAGVALAGSSSAVLERWSESRSVFPPAEYPPGQRRPALKRAGGLRSLVGRGQGDNVYLDLRAQGPHALVGGTTGAGKSEFLQTWIMGMATAYSPQRVTFLFVDYKGGAAFADCVPLPHCVGLVTDLSPVLVRRALTSLRAEVRHREHLLNRSGAKDLLEMETSGHPDTPPSLVIIVDEFAALVQEVPEFVDGVVDIAQRGRSLGLHLILATQRPAGVIKDNLRANTNLRVALRMADADDSRDVIGTTEAADFAPGLPGRAVAKTGPGRLEAFQAGYVGGWTHSEAPPPSIAVETLAFGPMVEWSAPEPSTGIVVTDEGPTDIERIVGRVVEASNSAGLPAPRRPWLPELNSIYEFKDLQLPRTDQALGFGVIDDPDAQLQHVVSYEPDTDGNLAVFGTGGAGKSAFLRTIAVSAGLTQRRGGPCVVYGLDFGSRGLQMIEALPHVGSVVSGDDEERVARLIRQLRETVDERAVRYSAARAGTISEYRDATNSPDEPRVILLIDGMGALRSAYESGPQSALLETLSSIAVDGRQVGVHLVISADRVGAIPNALASSIQRNIVLRLASDMDLLTLGVPADGFERSTPPGRGYIDQQQVQVAVLGGTRSVAEQSAAVQSLAARLRQEGVSEAPEVRSLPERVELSSLPVLVDPDGNAVVEGGDPTFAVADETLAPIGFDPTVPLLIAGPARSGRTTAVQTVVESLRRSRPNLRCDLFAHRRSPLAQLGIWNESAQGMEAVTDLATRLTSVLDSDSLGASHNGASSGAPVHVLVIEGIGEFVNSEADFALVDLIKAARSSDVLVIAEGETPTLSGSWPLIASVKSARHGVVLQPDSIDGDALFNTSFGRVSRADFPEGRGVYVRAGRAERVQIALP